MYLHKHRLKYFEGKVRKKEECIFNSDKCLDPGSYLLALFTLMHSKISEIFSAPLPTPDQIPDALLRIFNSYVIM